MSKKRMALFFSREFTVREAGFMAAATVRVSLFGERNGLRRLKERFSR
jgi:hypothetical protein